MKQAALECMPGIFQGIELNVMPPLSPATNVQAASLNHTIDLVPLRSMLSAPRRASF